MAITEQIIETRPSADIPDFFEWDNNQKSGTSEETWENKIQNCTIPGFSFNYNLSNNDLTNTINFVYDDFTAMNLFKEYINISKLNSDTGVYYATFSMQPVINLLGAPPNFSLRSVYTFPEEVDVGLFNQFSIDSTLVDLIVEPTVITMINNFENPDDYSRYAFMSTIFDNTLIALAGTKTLTYTNGLYVPE